jgi:hypothetical protein
MSDKNSIKSQGVFKLIIQSLVQMIKNEQNQSVSDFYDNNQQLIADKLAIVLSRASPEEMNLTQGMMDNITFKDDDPLHLLSNMLGEVLDDLEFNSELVDEAKKLFLLAETSS